MNCEPPPTFYVGARDLSYALAVGNEIDDFSPVKALACGLLEKVYLTPFCTNHGVSPVGILDGYTGLWAMGLQFLGLCGQI